jgi:hypothetical protein
MFRLWLETLGDFPLGTILAILLAAIFGAAIGIFSYGIFTIADRWDVESQKTEAVVIGKNFSPAHTTTTVVMSNNIMVPIITEHPDTWTITVDVSGQSEGVEVSEATYDQTDIHQTVEATIQVGKYSEDIYVESVRPYH